MRHLMRLMLMTGIALLGQLALYAIPGNIATRDYPDPAAWPGYSAALTAPASCPFTAEMLRQLELTPAQEAQIAEAQGPEGPAGVLINDRDALVARGYGGVAVSRLERVPATVVPDTMGLFLVLERVLTPVQLAQLPPCLDIAQPPLPRETP